MGDCDCDLGDCGDCDCGDCNCCDDCNCCGECNCCDNDGSNDNGCCDCTFCGSWCVADTALSAAEDIDHVSNRRKKDEEEEDFTSLNGAVPQTQNEAQPVMTQPGADLGVITNQPRGDPPSYESVIENT